MSATETTKQSKDNQVINGGPGLIIAYLVIFILVAAASLYLLGMHPAHVANEEHGAPTEKVAE